MKTAEAFKIQAIQRGLDEGRQPIIAVHGRHEQFRVASIQNHVHSVVIGLDKLGGTLTLSPDEIQYVWLGDAPTGEAI